MLRYLKIEVVSEKEINKYLTKGWEVIDTTKELLGDGKSTILQYHVGYPVSKHIQNLIEIIKEYEKFGFKEKLFKNKAQEYNENLEDYDTSGFFNANTNLTNFLKNYEYIVNGKEVEYYKNPKNENVYFE